MACRQTENAAKIRVGSRAPAQGQGCRNRSGFDPARSTMIKQRFKVGDQFTMTCSTHCNDWTYIDRQ